MVTYNTNKKSKAHYLTSANSTGKKVLNYLHKMCEKTLTYCQKQGLTRLEDFAEALESISEEDNPKLKIDVTVNTGGIGMKLAKQPELGSTTGKYMMQHLGFDEDEQGKFTRSGIEGILNPDLEDPLEEDDLNFLDKEEEDMNDELNNFLEEEDESPLEDLLAEEEDPSPPSPPRKDTPSHPPQKKTLDYDNILDQAAGISAVAATSGQEIDGINLSGLGAQASLLTTLVGKNVAQKILAAAKAAGQEKQVNDLVERINTAQERSNELSERSEHLTQFLSETPENQPHASVTQPKTPETSQMNSSPGEILAKVVSNLDQEIDATGLSEEKSKPIVVDKKANLDQQLQQLNTALDRIEKRLDRLESRLTALEEAIFPNIEKSEHESLEPSSPLNPAQATLYFDGGARGNPGVAAGAAVIVMPDGETHVASQFLEQATNNEAEYVGLITGLKKAQELGCEHLEVKGDSKLVIDQMLGKKKVRSPHLVQLHTEAQDLMNQLQNPDMSWIRRSDNILADQAVNDCIDHNLQSQFDFHNSPSPQSTHLTHDCANILLNVYKIGEQQAKARGESVHNGILLGESAILYGTQHKNSTTISIENFTGDELFVAHQNQGNWTIAKDFLTEQDKQEIQSLKDLDTELKAESSPSQKRRPLQQMQA